MAVERPRLPYPCLCLVTDVAVCPSDELAQRVSEAVDGGVDMVQLRAKDLPGGVLLALAKELDNAIQGGALLIVNERVDVAVAAASGGVQLGETGLPIQVSRRMLGDEALVGRSVHSVDGARGAMRSGADFLLVGTMFATRSHPGEEPSGPGLLTRIRAAGVDGPMLAIGGITQHNAEQVMVAGADGVAVITAILAASDPHTAAQALKAAITDATNRNPIVDLGSGLTTAQGLTGGDSRP